MIFSLVITMTSCSLGLRGLTSPMARSIYVSASVAAVPIALASMTTAPGYFPVCRLASRKLRSNARALEECKVLNSALKRRPVAVTSSASPPGTLLPLSKTCMSNRSASVSAIVISIGSGSLPGLMFLALLTFLCVATRTRSAGDVACNERIMSQCGFVVQKPPRVRITRVAAACATPSPAHRRSQCDTRAVPRGACRRTADSRVARHG
jgi:hypothetical protein